MMKELEQLPIPLLLWYRENARVLPWRSDPTPYRVWISEIMLQQTRVAAVLDYYRRFLEAVPTVADLAALPEDALMKLWQGLGYYSRARNLQKAARQIVENFGGVFPNTYDEIRSLAGVGDYTAGAVASIAFGLPVPAVDGNVLRVVTRITGDTGDITTPAVKRRITEALRQIIPTEAPGQFNQAMMELGATVCLPNGAPLCDRCPGAEFCRARLEDRIEQLPVKAPKKARRVEQRRVYLIFSDRGWPCTAGRTRGCWPDCGSTPMSLWKNVRSPLSSGLRRRNWNPPDRAGTFLPISSGGCRRGPPVSRRKPFQRGGCGPTGRPWPRTMRSPTPSRPFGTRWTADWDTFDGRDLR